MIRHWAHAVASMRVRDHSGCANEARHQVTQWQAWSGFDEGSGSRCGYCKFKCK